MLLTMMLENADRRKAYKAVCNTFNLKHGTRNCFSPDLPPFYHATQGLCWGYECATGLFFLGNMGLKLGSPETVTSKELIYVSAGVRVELDLKTSGENSIY